jgi:hypothetical protein
VRRCGIGDAASVLNLAMKPQRQHHVFGPLH